jgi:CarboxypepD_reg-like domain/Gram-negative bacterial TonB protein C-terminal
MEHNKSYINYSADDIQRYLGGKMTPLEMNALEKAAVDDPFLAEAIEGYGLVPETEWKAPLQSLKESFAAGTAPAKLVTFTSKKYNWFKYAAAVLILGGGISTYLMLNRNGKTADDKTVAAAEKTTPGTSNEAVTAAPTADSIATAQTGNDVLANAKDRKILLDNLKKDTQSIAANWSAMRQKDNLSPVGIVDYKQGEAVRAEALKEQTLPVPSVAAAPQVPAKTDDVAGAKVMDAERDVAANASRSADVKNENFYNQQAIIANTQNQARNNRAMEVNRNFSAQVVDADNNPLPFANINVKNEGFGTYADVRGNVRLISTDSVIPVEIKSLGFKTQTIVLRSNQQQNRIVLQEDESSAYREKTAALKKANTGVISRRAMLQRDSAQNAEPADGWDNYGTYVANNLEIPDDVLNKNIHGSVELSFDVKRNGTITNVKVDKSLCGDCDELARRIVEQGPQWKLKKGRKAKAKVIVHF